VPLATLPNCRSSAPLRIPNAEDQTVSQSNSPSRIARYKRIKKEVAEMPKEDAIALLKQDHATVKKLFAEEEKSSGQKKAGVFEKIKAALEVHATIEEEIFYPAVKKARSENVKDEVREAYEEHKQIKSLLALIANITPADETWDAKVKVLKEDVEHHVGEEEGEMFPDAKKFLHDAGLVALGAQMEARKQQLEKEPASKPAPRNQSGVHSAK
jgi:iron-sulfur cluster repair protein YtfE (RIC family)